MDASLMKASALRLRFSLSLASRRQRLSQAMVRSTIVRNTRRVRFQLSSVCPDKALFTLVAARLDPG